MFDDPPEFQPRNDQTLIGLAWYKPFLTVSHLWGPPLAVPNLYDRLQRDSISEFFHWIGRKNWTFCLYRAVGNSPDDRQQFERHILIKGYNHGPSEGNYIQVSIGSSRTSRIDEVVESSMLKFSFICYSIFPYLGHNSSLSNLRFYKGFICYRLKACFLDRVRDLCTHIWKGFREGTWVET